MYVCVCIARSRQAVYLEFGARVEFGELCAGSRAGGQFGAAFVGRNVVLWEGSLGWIIPAGLPGLIETVDSGDYG